MLKGSPILARLLALSKSGSATGETKSKIIRIVTSLSKDTPPVPPPEGARGPTRYENVNIRLYNDDSKVQEPTFAPLQHQHQPQMPRSRHEPAPRRPMPAPATGEDHSYGIDAGQRRSQYKPQQPERSLRNVGYSAIHDRNQKVNLNYNSMEESKTHHDEVHETPINSYSRQINQNSYQKPPMAQMSNDYDFPLEGGARREPLVKIPFNDNLLHDYCLMLDKENNRDINIFAIQSLEPLIKD